MGADGVLPRRLLLCCRSCAGTVAWVRRTRQSWWIFPTAGSISFSSSCGHRKSTISPGLLIIAAITLFLMNSVGGRIWCGYLCPQTVWTDLYYAGSRRMVEGDRRERMRKAAARGTMKLERFAEITLKHSIWLLDRMVDRRRLVLYFNDAPDAGESSFATFHGADAGLYLDRDIDGRPPICSPASCASRSASTCARGRVSRPP